MVRQLRKDEQAQSKTCLHKWTEVITSKFQMLKVSAMSFWEKLRVRKTSVERREKRKRNVEGERGKGEEDNEEREIRYDQLGNWRGGMRSEEKYAQKECPG